MPKRKMDTQRGRKRTKRSKITPHQPGVLYKTIPYVEKRYMDTFFGALGASTAYQIHGLSAVRAGDDIFERSSRRIMLKSLQYKFTIYPNTASVTMHYWRFCIVHDKESTALPTYAEVFSSLSATGVITSDVYAYPNANNISRFTVLRDHRFMTQTSHNAPGSAGDFQVDGSLSIPIMPVEGYIKLNSIAEYPGTGIGNPISGALYAFIINDDFAPVAVDWNYNIATRLIYSSQ